ncbi:MAG: glycosyltransferase [Desulfomonilia bacterium]
MDTSRKLVTTIQHSFDSIVMLTWSDWFTEMRSNRYHYASRFSKHLPVIFVQPDLLSPRYVFESTELPHVTVLHVYRHYGSTQSALIAQALNSRHIIRPLLWSYNYLFLDFIATCYSPLKVYHATEDYFSADFVLPSVDDTTSKLKRVLHHTSLLISVSDGIQEDYIIKGGYKGYSEVITNGCDFKFWHDVKGDPHLHQAKPNKPVALYQGGISRKIDFQLMKEVAGMMSDWEFRFSGKLFLYPDEMREWNSLLSHENVTYLGYLGMKELKQQMLEATVGLIPFVPNDWIQERSFPLKTFEYLACGLPVVSIPIRSLESYRQLISLARSPEEFSKEIRKLSKTRDDPELIKLRKEAARDQDYDIKFHNALDSIQGALDNCDELGMFETYPDSSRLNVLILYDKGSTHVCTIKEHLDSFLLHSRHHITYANATREAQCSFDLSLFDAVVLHYSVRVSLTSHLSKSYAEKLKGYPGLKILFIQDEYNTTATAWDWIRTLGIHIVYTCVPEPYLDYVYPRKMFRYVRFIHNLTGYIPLRLEQMSTVKPLRERSFPLGYRGRKLPYWYGTLGYEKYIIGLRMKQICEERGIPVNIECDDSQRIYGENWYNFIENCRAVLGTESGSNVFDFRGKIKEAIEDELRNNPEFTFSEAYEKYLREHEDHVTMNQISPKIFEAAALGTALVLFEGEYSGIIKPDVHFIPLKKDFSNVDEVLCKLEDIDFLEQLTQRAHRDLIESGLYTYKNFINDFDTLLSSALSHGQGKILVTTITAWKDVSDGKIYPMKVTSGLGSEDRLHPMNMLLSRDTIIERRSRLIYNLYLMLSDILPQWVKNALFPIFRPLKRWIL